MANTTISQLTPLTGTAVANDDSFLIYDASANAEKQIVASELKNMVGNGTFTITTSSANDALVVTSTDTGATGAPDIVFFRNSASPAANDLIGNVVFRGKNSLAANTNYASINTQILSPTSSAEQSSITFSVINGGTSTERMRINNTGAVSIGSNVVSAGDGLRINKAITGATSSYGVFIDGTIQSDVTTTTNMVRTLPSIVNSSFTLPNLFHYTAGQGSWGANAIVNQQIGFLVEGSMSGANTNYGFFQNAVAASNVTTGKTVIAFYANHPIATGGGNSWNFYADGTAPNYFLGNVLIGTASSDGSKLRVSGNAAITSTLSVTGNITGGAQIVGKYTALSSGTTAMALATNAVVKVTPTATATYTTTVAPAGSRASVIIVTSGTTSYTITFGTGFKTTGTLATGTTTARTFAIDFVSDGTSMIETSRTAAMA